MTLVSIPALVPAAALPVGDAVRSRFAIELPSGVLDGLRAGDRSAFDRVYRLFERPVYTLALRMLGGAHGDGREAAADVVQDTMLKVYRSAPTYRGDGAPFWSWLRQIAVNEALMRLRREQRHIADMTLDEGAEHEDLSPPPAAAADAAALQRALALLPAMTRSVLWLYHGEGYTHDEIAELMQRTPSFSKSQLARGTRRLRQLLETGGTAAGEVSHGR